MTTSSSSSSSSAAAADRPLLLNKDGSEFTTIEQVTTWLNGAIQEAGNDEDEIQIIYEMLCVILERMEEDGHLLPGSDGEQTYDALELLDEALDLAADDDDASDDSQGDSEEHSEDEEDGEDSESEDTTNTKPPKKVARGLWARDTSSSQLPLSAADLFDDEDDEEEAMWPKAKWRRH